MMVIEFCTDKNLKQEEKEFKAEGERSNLP
jgi:hypothetical protein